MPKTPLQKYKAATISSGDPLNQLVFIFDEVLKFLYITKKAIQEKDYETKFKSLTKIADVFYVLRSGLHTQGEGDAKKVSEMLASFYDVVIYNVHQLNMKAQEPSEVDVVITAVSTVRNSMQNEINKSSSTNSESKE